MDKPLVNRVAASGLITLKLEDYFPQEEMAHFDLKGYLFMEMVLKEKDFREALKQHDWEQYAGKTLLVYCSADAIIPVWAYMLVAANAKPFVSRVFQGEEQDFLKLHYQEVINGFELDEYQDKRIVVKGCSEKPVPPAAYLAATEKLQAVAKSIMYGEPCSTVPVYKKPR